MKSMMTHGISSKIIESLISANIFTGKACRMRYNKICMYSFAATRQGRGGE